MVTAPNIVAGTSMYARKNTLYQILGRYFEIKGKVVSRTVMARTQLHRHRIFHNPHLPFRRSISTGRKSKFSRLAFDRCTPDLISISPAPRGGTEITVNPVITYPYLDEFYLVLNASAVRKNDQYWVLSDQIKCVCCKRPRKNH